jgi:biopolymer transport protein TolQ
MDTVSQMDVAGMVAGATPTVKAVLLLLAVLSVWSWTVIFRNFAAYARASSRLRAGSDAFESAADFGQAALALDADSPSPFVRQAGQACREAQALFKAPGMPPGERSLAARAFEGRLELGAAREAGALSRGLGLLGVCAVSSPFIGLFGTVWGIMNSFHQIGLSKSVTLMMVAPGISEALLATAAGLCVAIPAAIAHNAFSARLDALEDGMEVFAKSFKVRTASLLAGEEPGEGAP